MTKQRGDVGHVWMLNRRAALLGLGAVSLAAPSLLDVSTARGGFCSQSGSTPIEGPYYLGSPQPEAPTGRELVIEGTVRDADTCEPIAGAEIVRWHSNRFGVYEDYYRRTLVTDAQGVFRLTSIVPGQYAGLQRHVHFHARAEGYADVINQWQIADGASPSELEMFDFVLRRG